LGLDQRIIEEVRRPTISAGKNTALEATIFRQLQHCHQKAGISPGPFVRFLESCEVAFETIEIFRKFR